jgi:hypothetical protein
VDFGVGTIDQDDDVGDTRIVVVAVVALWPVAIYRIRHGRWRKEAIAVKMMLDAAIKVVEAGGGWLQIDVV